MSSVTAGDVVCVSGTYTSNLSISGKTGTASQPITIQATTPLGTTLYSLEVKNSPYVVVRDFVFKSKASTLLKIVGSPNAKVLRNDFDHSGADAGGVAIGQSGLITSATIVEDANDVVTSATPSDNVEIAYNSFRDHTFANNNFVSKKSGSFIKTQVDEGVGGAVVISKNLHIHHNYFKNMAPHISAGQTVPDGDSDREAIAFGTADSQQVVTNHIVEHNMFEDCDGENEIITVKTSGNVLRYNTFKNSFGSLSIRFGNANEAYGNYFFGEGASATYTDPNYQTGGIRIYGTNHKVYNNYMQGLTGTSWRQPILLDSGDTDSTTGDKHQRPKFVEIAYNTVVDSAGGINVGDNQASSGYNSKPQNNKIANNIVIGASGSLFNDSGDTASGKENTWEGNIAYATGSATATSGTAKSSGQVLLADPVMVSVSKNGISLKTLASNSPAINAGAGTYSYVSKDIDGETRNTPDAGADEYSASPVLTYKPLKATDVGPSAP